MTRRVLGPTFAFKSLVQLLVAAAFIGMVGFTGLPWQAAAAAAYNLPAPTIRQDMSLDCESAALAIALQTVGIGLSQNWVFNTLPKQPPFWAGDPNRGFIGNVNAREGSGSGTGYGVYAPPIAAVARAAGANAEGPGGSTASFTGWTVSQIEAQIAAGNPVVIWIDYRSLGSGHGYSVSYHRVADGTVVPYTWHEHAVTVVGYIPSANTLTLIDVYSGHHFTYSAGQLSSMLSTFGGMAVAVSRGPAISSLNPNYGPDSGAQTVTVHGRNFVAGLTATLGSLAITPENLSSTSFTFTTPATPVGNLPLRVTLAGHTSPLTPASYFDSYGPALISSLSPAAGPVTGNQSITVRGAWFSPSQAVTLDGTSVTPTNIVAGPSGSFTFVTPAHAAGYTQLQVTTGLGASALTASAGYIYTPLASYFPLTPYRVLDTRKSGGPLGPSSTRTVTIATDPAATLAVPTNATAVVLNVTAVNSTSAGLLTIYPTGTSRPLVSNLNFSAHTVVANLVTVTLGQTSAADTNREVSIYNPVGSVNVVADVEGYFAPQAATNPTGEFHPLVPLRLLDTRQTGGPLGPGQVERVNLSGPAGSVPSDGSASAAVFNLTGLSGSQPTFLAVYPTRPDGSCPSSSSTSNLNLVPRSVGANRVIVPLGPATLGGATHYICVFNAGGSSNFVLDLTGWFGSAAAPLGTQYQAIGPTRICDTRAGCGRALGSGGALTIPVSGNSGIPASGPLAIIANLTAVNGTASTFLTAYPADAPQPRASDLTPPAHAVVANLVVVGLSASGQLRFYNAAGSINLVVDIEGWFQ